MDVAFSLKSSDRSSPKIGDRSIGSITADSSSFVSSSETTSAFSSSAVSSWNTTPVF
jgi:hypothetical protein